MHGNIPFLFDFWADPFLLKSSMEQCNKKCLRVYCEPQSDHTVQRGGPIFVDLSHLLARASASFIMTSISASNRGPQTEGGGGRGPFLSEGEREREREKDNSFHDLTSQLERSDIGNRFLHKTNGSVDIEFDLSDYLPT